MSPWKPACRSRFRRNIRQNIEDTGYHQAAIRELEMPRDSDRIDPVFSLSNGSRRFLRYGYGGRLNKAAPRIALPYVGRNAAHAALGGSRVRRCIRRGIALSRRGRRGTLRASLLQGPPRHRASRRTLRLRGRFVESRRRRLAQIRTHIPRLGPSALQSQGRIPISGGAICAPPSGRQPLTLRPRSPMRAAYCRC